MNRDGSIAQCALRAKHQLAGSDVRAAGIGIDGGEGKRAEADLGDTAAHEGVGGDRSGCVVATLARQSPLLSKLMVTESPGE